MKKGVVIIGLIVCLVGGFGVGLLTGVFIPELPTSTLVEQIQARGIIIVGTSSDWPPFEIYNTTTEQYEGFDIDLTEMIADELDVTVQWTDMDFDALPHQPMDTIPAASCLPNHTRHRIEKTCQHSNPLRSYSGPCISYCPHNLVHP